MSQWVRIPPGKGTVSQPEASFVWRTVRCVVKRKQRVVKRRYRPPIKISDDAFTVSILGAVPEFRKRQGAEGCPGSENGGIATGGLTRESGRQI